MKEPVEKWESGIYYLPPIHHCCGNDDMRQAMNYVHIKNRRAFATDAYALVHFDIAQVFSEETCIKLEGKLIHKNTWRALCTMASKFKVTGLMMAVDGDTILAKDFDFQGYRAFEMKTEGLDNLKFPKCTEVWNSAIETAVEKIEQFMFGMNPAVLGKIEKAIDPQGGLVMCPVRPKNGVLIVGNPQRKDDMVIYALAMPTILSGLEDSVKTFSTLPL